MLRYFALAALALVPTVLAQSSAYGQCGGQGWSGATTCVAGYTCTYSNPYYSQCLPGSKTTTTSSSSSSTGTKTTTTTVTTTGSSTSTAPSTTGTGYQIRAVEDPVFHFYLQDNAGTVVLGPEASGDYYAITGGTIQSNTNGLYLNAATSASTSYKALTWGTSATTTSWQLEGDTIILNNPRTLEFIACTTTNANYYTLYLQEGSQTPSGQTCSTVDLHLPCLC